MERTQVLVVGAGPAGVVAAYILALGGVDVVVVEAAPACPEDLRASTLHPPTLQMLAELGVFEALDAQGLRAPVYHYRNRRSGEVFAFDLTEIADATPYPFRLQCEQFKLTRLLARLIDEHPHGSVRFSCRLLTIEQDGQGVTAKMETPYAIAAIRADYVIAADGANSLVRKWLGIDFDGFTYPEKFLTLSTLYPLERAIPGLAHVNYVADAEEWCVLLRVPAFWRVLVPSSGTETDEQVWSDANKTAVFSRLVGQAEAASLHTEHRTIYRVHQRVATTFLRDRVILVGDAAHLNNPLGGFGMNSGIHDAWNLARKLIDICKSNADPRPLLDRYDRQRRTVMHEFIQAQTMQNKAALEAGSAEAQAAQQRRMAAILSDPARRREYLLTQAMIRSVERSAAIS